MTEMGLFCTNRSNTSPSMEASLMAKLKKAYRTQYRHTLTPLVSIYTRHQRKEIAQSGKDSGQPNRPASSTNFRKEAHHEASFSSAFAPLGTLGRRGLHGSG